MNGKENQKKLFIKAMACTGLSQYPCPIRVGIHVFLSPFSFGWYFDIFFLTVMFFFQLWLLISSSLG